MTGLDRLCEATTATPHPEHEHLVHLHAHLSASRQMALHRRDLYSRMPLNTNKNVSLSMRVDYLLEMPLSITIQLHSTRLQQPK